MTTTLSSVNMTDKSAAVRSWGWAPSCCTATHFWPMAKF